MCLPTYYSVSICVILLCSNSSLLPSAASIEPSRTKFFHSIIITISAETATSHFQLISTSAIQSEFQPSTLAIDFCLITASSVIDSSLPHPPLANLQLVSCHSFLSLSSTTQLFQCSHYDAVKFHLFGSHACQFCWYSWTVSPTIRPVITFPAFGSHACQFYWYSWTVNSTILQLPSFIHSAPMLVSSTGIHGQ